MEKRFKSIYGYFVFTLTQNTAGIRIHHSNLSPNSIPLFFIDLSKWRWQNYNNQDIFLGPTPIFRSYSSIFPWRKMQKQVKIRSNRLLAQN